MTEIELLSAKRVKFRGKWRTVIEVQPFFDARDNPDGLYVRFFGPSDFGWWSLDTLNKESAKFS